MPTPDDLREVAAGMGGYKSVPEELEALTKHLQIILTKNTSDSINLSLARLEPASGVGSLDMLLKSVALPKSPPYLTKKNTLERTVPKRDWGERLRPREVVNQARTQPQAVQTVKKDLQVGGYQSSKRELGGQMVLDLYESEEVNIFLSRSQEPGGPPEHAKYSCKMALDSMSRVNYVTELPGSRYRDSLACRSCLDTVDTRAPSGTW